MPRNKTLSVSITIRDEFTVRVQELQQKLGDIMLEALQPTIDYLREWYRTYPGMPYTKPGLWDASQMAADRG